GGTRVFVADEAGNRVLAVDPGTMQVVGQYPTESRPGALLVSADGRRLYVGHHEAKVLLALDASSGRELGRAALGGRPDELAGDRATSLLLAASADTGEVRVVGAPDLGVRRVIRVEGRLGAVALSADGARGYV